MPLFNICLGCHDVGDVRTCKEIECFAYGERKNVLEMDDCKNNMLLAQAKRVNYNVRLGG